MNQRSDRAAGRFALSTFSFLAIAVGVPYLLVRVSTARFGSANPLGGVNSWDSGAIGDALRNPLSDDTVVDLLLRACLCVAWIAVGVIVVNTIVEVVHQVRHRGVPMPAMRGLGWSQGVARFIAVGVLVVMPMTSVRPSLAQAPVGDPWAPAAGAPLVIDYGGAFDQSSRGTNGGPQEVAPDTAPAVATYTVQRGDSVFSIAANLANHDEQRTLDIADEILDLNLDATMADGQRFSNPAYVEPGWVLRLPTTPSANTPAAITSAAVATPPDLGENDVHVVAPGDTLWGIAEDEYGSGTEWAEIWDENAGDDMGGGRSFDDPNLILPGWELDVPAEGVSAEVVPPEPPIIATPIVETPASTPPSEPPSPWAEPIDPVAGAAPSDPAATTAAPEAPTPTTTSTSTSTSTTPSTTTSTVVPIGGRTRAVEPGPTSAPDAPAPIRLEHAAMLAAGILMLVGVRRRQRLRAATPRSRVPEPRPEVVETELLLRRIEPGERGPRIDVACRSAAFHLIGTGVQIAVVQVSPDGEIALTLSGDHFPPAPWTGDGDNVWHLPAAIPVELLSESARRVGMPCVAFAQLGVDGDGWEVLVDLEACGTLAIDGQPSQADAVVRGLAAGLATSLYAEVAHFVTVAMSPDVLLDHRNAHQAESIDAAFDHAATLVGSTSMDERSSFELRSLRTGGEMWEPAVILLTDRDAIEQADGVPLPAAGHGIALVAVVGPNGLPGAPARLRAEPTEWILTVAGRSISMTPIGLDRADVDAVLAILHDAEQPLIWMDALVPSESPITDSTAALPGASEADDPESNTFEPIDHEIVVRLLGAVEVWSADGVRAEFERSKTVELIAWLVTHRTNSTRGLARTALWELDVRDATFANVVSEARRGMARLVTLHDGEEWLARTLTEQLPLHPLVVSDAQLVEQRLAHARLQPPSQAIETLRPAVAMIDGMPFAGTSYLWPDAEGITSNLVLLAMSACTELAEHALSMGDIELVFEATSHGLAVLPAHEGLIALRMRSYAKSGDLAGVRQEWENYERVIVADAWSDGEPAPQLVDLRRDLLGP